MADDEQFSLCWNNFNSNLSAGFHESLCRGDLVDVTLAAEGQFVKAHRLVLSVCSPYFRKMFTQMPANQHAFVFLKDVSHSALKDLIQFMYCGEVNVKQEALPAFISTAEALQIKGLTDSDPPQSQTPPEPSTPTPQTQQQIQTSPRVRQRTSTARSYKIETVEDSGDDAKQTTQIVIQTTAPSHPPQASITTQPQQQQQHHQPQHLTQQTLHTQAHQLTNVSMPSATTTTVVTQKRPAQRANLASVPHIKRSKSTIDPLEASDATTATHQINVQTSVVTDAKTQIQHHHHQQQQQQHQSHHQQAQQQASEPEYIDLPIDLPTKSEPDYAEEAGEVDQSEQDAAYVEDESYGDMRYDESYFTENEDGATGGNTTATSTQNASSTTATTSKAVVKQQPLSDSYMDTSADPANSDAQGSDVTEKPVTDQNRVKYRTSLKGSYQLVLDEFPYTRHRIRGGTIYWRCVQFRPLNCKARVRTNPSGDRVSIVDEDHNHGILQERRKKGSLKHVYEQRKLAKEKKTSYESATRKLLFRQPCTTRTNLLCKSTAKRHTTTQIDFNLNSSVQSTNKKMIIVDETKIVPLDPKVVQDRLTSPETVIKRAHDGHTLNIINRKRILGNCVYCLKNPTKSKQKLPRITSFCPKCPEGCWMCESCFDEIHQSRDKQNA